MTKLSHLHFVSTDIYRDRILQMGEEPHRVVISGSLAIDAMINTELMSTVELKKTFEFDAGEPFILATFHPVTLEADQTETHIRNLLSVVETIGSESGMSTVFTAPNPDTSSDLILSAIQRFTSESHFTRLILNAGSRGYFSLMNEAEVMMGNSSSGIAEAPSFGLPVVNIGTRQTGRIRAANIIDCGYEVQEIMDAVNRAMSPEFKSGITGMLSPFGDGHAAERIVERILSIGSLNGLLRKRFSSFDRQNPTAKGSG
jgi:UDP-hydrolysing UDP-N-acetyl-D-glucosamine 2-epimerase